MTAKEVKEKYQKLFIMIMEDAATESGIKEYKEVEEIIENNPVQVINFERQKEILEDDGADLQIFICFLIIRVIMRLVGVDNLDKVDNLEERIEDIFQRYLIVPTHKFTSKYGLPTIKTVWDKNLKIWVQKISK